MNHTSTNTFEYKDRNFGDTESLVVATKPEVFYPTSTTNLLLAAVRKHADPAAATVLDLGCGCGIVAVAMAKVIFSNAKIHASDISAEAVQLTQQNAAAQQVAIDARCGSMFEPWAGMKFDLIVDDVAGIAEPIARLSQWYPPQIHSDAGEDGTRWIVNILAQAPDFLAPRGRIFFPALTLSNEAKIMETAQANFAKVELVTEQWYPLGNDLLPHMSAIEDLAARGMVELKKKGSRWLWATKVYCASKQ
ncbi:methyltransferase [candidate division KSB1 bacterium]|nr:methyltransferase [candidate division KSB1 bacterium]